MEEVDPRLCVCVCVLKGTYTSSWVSSVCYLKSSSKQAYAPTAVPSLPPPINVKAAGAELDTALPRRVSNLSLSLSLWGVSEVLERAFSQRDLGGGGGGPRIFLLKGLLLRSILSDLRGGGSIGAGWGWRGWGGCPSSTLHPLFSPLAERGPKCWQTMSRGGGAYLTCQTRWGELPALGDGWGRRISNGG